MKTLVLFALACASLMTVTVGPAFAHPRTEVCTASWYGPKFNGKPMANGHIFNMNDPQTVAHKTLPLGTKVRITNINNGRSLLMTVRDRGPYVKGRCADVSEAAAKQLGLYLPGTGKVKLEVLD